MAGRRFAVAKSKTRLRLSVVRFVPLADIAGVLFDHLVGAREELARRIEAKRLGGFQIDRQLKLGRELDRQVAGLFAVKNAIDIGCRAPEQVGKANVCGQPTAPAAPNCLTSTEASIARQ